MSVIMPPEEKPDVLPLSYVLTCRHKKSKLAVGFYVEKGKFCQTDSARKFYRDQMPIIRDFWTSVSTVSPSFQTATIY